MMNSYAQQSNFSLSSYLQKAKSKKYSLQITVMDAMLSCPANSKIDQVDNIFLVAGIPEVGKENVSTGYDNLDKKGYSAQEWQSIHDRTYNNMRSSGVSDAQAQGLANQTATLNDPKTAAFFYMVAIWIAGEKSKGLERKFERKNILKFRAYYKQGMWAKAVQVLEVDKTRAGNPPAILQARAMRRAVEDGSIKTWDVPGQLMDKRAYAQKALDLYNEAVTKLDANVPDNIAQTIKAEAEDWKKKVESGSY